MKPTFEISPDTVIIARHLEAMAQGAQVTYAELNALVKWRDLQKHDRHLLDSARSMVLKNNSIVIECVHGIGVARLTDSEISMLPAFTLGKIRRAAKRSCKKTICAKYDSLSPAEKIKFNAGISLLGAIALCSSDGKRKLVENSVMAVGDKLSFSKTISLFQ